MQSPSNVKLGRERTPTLDMGGPPPMRAATRVRRFLRDHGRKLWWLHSGYALALGMVVITGASNLLYVWLRARTERWIR